MSTARASILLFGAAFLFASLGCAGTNRGSGRPVPTYEEIAQRHNARVAELDTIWSRATVEAHFLEPDGSKHWEQGRGHLQVRQPDKLALSIGKFGELYFWFGCDGERFWALNMEQSTAHVGSRADDFVIVSGKETAAAIPVHSEQLMFLMGIRALAERTPGQTIEVVRRDGLYWFEVSSEWGPFQIGVDPARLEPAHVELLNEDGVVRVRSTLTEYGGVRVEGRAGNFPRIATFAVIEEPAQDFVIKIRLSEGRERRSIPPAVFDLEYLLDAYAIKRVEPL